MTVAATWSPRDAAEVHRSAQEALRVQPTTVDWQRYMSPPRDTLFGLEYAYHLLGDVRGKTVLDFGCGAGQNLIPLRMRGADVIGIDISPQLVDIARARVSNAGMKAELRVASAYNTGLPSASIDRIFSIALVHHVDILSAREEMRRILAPGGQVVFAEPIRFSRAYARLRSWLPSREDVPVYEHPLNRKEFADFTSGFAIQDLRYFRLPFVPLAERVFRVKARTLWQVSDWALQHVPGLQRYATCAVGRMVDSGPAVESAPVGNSLTLAYA
jgi:SAM-dependent methyltransferase